MLSLKKKEKKEIYTLTSCQNESSVSRKLQKSPGLSASVNNEAGSATRTWWDVGADHDLTSGNSTAKLFLDKHPLSRGSCLSNYTLIT